LNLALYGSLPEQVQHGFPWLQWTIAASVAAGVMLVAYTGLSALVFHQSSRPRLSHESIRAQLKVLGPMSGIEWMSLGGALFFFAALMTPSAHQIDHRLIGLILVAIYLVLDVLKSDQINIDIDWSCLVLLGTLIGMINTVAYVDLDRFGAERLPWLSQMIKTQPHLFIAILSAVGLVARLLIPAAGALVALFFIPMTVVNGMNPWVVAFVILMMQDCWFMPGQSSSYRTFRSIVRLHQAYDERLFLRINAATVVMRMLAIAVSLVYWQQVHLL
jgi:divalent anion:Na+ symporter, DASS family